MLAGVDVVLYTVKALIFELSSVLSFLSAESINLCQGKSYVEELEWHVLGGGGRCGVGQSGACWL